MANTTAQLEVEGWVRETWLKKQYKTTFSKGKARLATGGSFEFDAVSKDGSIVVCVSTAIYRTASGRVGSGKLAKIRADTMFLSMSAASTRLLVFTDQSMFERMRKEQEVGRLPSPRDLTLRHATGLSAATEQRLRESRAAASREVSPRTRRSLQ